MQASTRQERSPKNGAGTAASPAQVLAAYLEKRSVVQAVIRDLVNLCMVEKVPPEERGWAETALQDALFRHQSSPENRRGRVVSVEETRQLAGVREAHQRMEEEERMFAANLVRLLEEKNISQAELARRVGVQPSAISMMLSRRCRPQRRTVEKMAQALAVDLRELWPG
jgi:lambda repressor-like predicted transcriptional regulator